MLALLQLYLNYFLREGFVIMRLGTLWALPGELGLSKELSQLGDFLFLKPEGIGVVNAGIGFTALFLIYLASSLRSKGFLDLTLDTGDIALYLFSSMKSLEDLLDKGSAVSGLLMLGLTILLLVLPNAKSLYYEDTELLVLPILPRLKLDLLLSTEAAVEGLYAD